MDENTGDVFLSTGPGQQDITSFNGATFRGTFQYKISDKLMLQPGVDLNREVGEGRKINGRCTFDWRLCWFHFRRVDSCSRTAIETGLAFYAQHKI
ncbi:MAG: hypothetical protein WDO15_23870 [Bacteroidota bacterium]